MNASNGVWYFFAVAFAFTHFNTRLSDTFQSRLQAFAFKGGWQLLRLRKSEQLVLWVRYLPVNAVGKFNSDADGENPSHAIQRNPHDSDELMNTKLLI